MQAGASLQEPWAPPTLEELRLSREQRWVLSLKDDKRSQTFLMSSTCIVCHHPVIRTSAMNGPLLVITPWQHNYAAEHEPALAEDQ